MEGSIGEEEDDDDEEEEEDKVVVCKNTYQVSLTQS